MQRLGDIVYSDLDKIMDVFMDFTTQVVLQCGSIKHTVNASLQSDRMTFNAETSPINAFTLSLYYRETNDTSFNDSLKKDAIIYINGIAHSIIDSAYVRGLRILSLKKYKGR